MASLSLKHIYKVYSNGTKAVNDFNMQIEDGEFIVFVGPSGCGKSTTLRMIAGLEDISAGELMIGDLVVNDVEPKDRDIAMVFQNYALYPHMTVYDNMTFGLKMRKVVDVKKDANGNPVIGKDGKPVTYSRKYTREEIHNLVLEAAKVLEITEYLEKKPKEMSGGQRQRVSLGRAIVRTPKVMLLDEPLSNLDAKLRTAMRAEILKLYAKLKTTFIYVTHDQIEAMTMGTRIVVMKKGFVQQIDTPKNLYNYPGNKFVAGFIGTPQMNFFEGTLLKKGNEVVISFAYTDQKITVPYSMLYKTKPSYLNGKTTVFIGLRAENVSLDPDVVKSSQTVINVKVSHKEELGNQTLIYGDINMDGDGYRESSTRIIINANGETEVKCGDIVKVALDIAKIHLFDKETEESILPLVPDYSYLDCTIKDGKIKFLGKEMTLPPAITCSDGSFELLVPTDSVTLGGDIEAVAESSEKVHDKYLNALTVGNSRVYIVTEKPLTGKCNVAVDIKRISILSEGETLVSEANTAVTLEGNLVKEKVTEQIEVDGKVKNAKVIKFMLNVGGVNFPVPDDTVQKIITAIGVKNAFKDKLRYECSAYDLKIADEGISANVVGVSDYGKEKFAVCKIGESEMLVYAENEMSGSVKLVPDISKLAIIQAERDIRII